MINLSQNIKLSMEQRLTPQQILLSTLLQLPLLSLEQRIKSELEVNPVLEEGEEQDENPDEEDMIEEPDDDEIEEISKELELLDQPKNNDEYDKKELEEAQADADLENYLNDDESFEIRIPRDKNEEEFERPEIHRPSLPEHLMEQLHMLDLDNRQLAIGEYLIWNIRDDGYLDASLNLETVANMFETDVQTVEKILKKIQFLDPTGVGSRDLRECLMVQLEEQGKQDTIAYKILKDHFDDFKNKHYEKIMEALHIDKEELQKNIDIIVKLNPKPGEGEFDARSNYIVPDFIVEKIDDKLVVTLNDWNIPPLRISNLYKKMLMDRKKYDKETRKYIRKKVESARWFITSIWQRKITMLKVMEAIVEKQREFFEKGPEYIKPLTMREIAEMIDMDISTVSRVANGKYVQTDYGVFELKYFFNEKIETEDGEEISTRRIKQRIQEIIDAEDKHKPLSDEKIAEILKKEGFPIARRTVAKYREQLQIPVARLRKEL
ncbi:RNA polymerase, sigma 54 subunit, RpoN [Caldithrix abyssi DSM 13497]|uniref:RNA polymerase, sigma 54 subunit, RpoN n=1 Tax=Caldithrix abyssi DSM 13497 TaxID=880073 RepID=H1XYD6_CALAY|nr:RNA polymerase factor sigma-54 [Caldithrix abyssi]APF19298.1 RNA polymerase, sigma 54 subunit, RpoN/SigL [Caldithrix abyssi DSM 13497]EHO43203.1 RNA polymerase, sigma 54 subunit, RpoN [Caldithrix abyssi DSM 13497]